MSQPVKSVPEPSDIDVLSAQSLVTLCAIEALIANHPQPDEVRKVFDQLFGQVSAGLLVSGLTPLGLGLARQFAEKIFSSPSMLS